MLSTTSSESVLILSGRMLSPARGLKFCGARARVACVVLAHAANRVTFHNYFESLSNVGGRFSTVLPLLAKRILLAILILHALIVEMHRLTTNCFNA